MKKRSILLLSLVLLFIVGCGQANLFKSYENLDESTRIINYTEQKEERNYSYFELEYIKDESMYRVWFSQNLRPSLDYLKANTKPSDVILTWWDNGHLIRGYAKRNPIVYTPHYDLLETVQDAEWDENKLGKFSKKDDLTNVAYALLADSPRITEGIMKRYNSKWIYVAAIDQKKIAGMVQLMDEDLNNYLDELDDPKQGVMHKVLFKMSDGFHVPGFKIAYEDEYAYIYKRLG